jgi:hypothetical protein
VAVDILAAQPQVDSSRLGAVGHSLGAKEVLYLAAFDERIKATVSSEGGVGIKFSNWNASWYLGAEVDEPNFAREHHELLALTAPRAFLLVGGQSADGDQGWPFIEAALPGLQALWRTGPDWAVQSSPGPRRSSRCRSADRRMVGYLPVISFLTFLPTGPAMKLSHLLPLGLLCFALGSLAFGGENELSKEESDAGLCLAL